jgi:hypothetical protein
MVIRCAKETNDCVTSRKCSISEPISSDGRKTEQLMGGSFTRKAYVDLNRQISGWERGLWLCLRIVPKNSTWTSKESYISC